jgi:hypothetical protein
MVTTAPEGEKTTRPRQGPEGSARWSTETVMVVVSPGDRVPPCRLRRSQSAPVDAVQWTSEPPDAVRVMTVTSPRGSAAIVSRPGPAPRLGAADEGDADAPAVAEERPPSDEGLAEATETETPAAGAPALWPGAAESAEPAFSYG